MSRCILSLVIAGICGAAAVTAAPPVNAQTADEQPRFFDPRRLPALPKSAPKPDNDQKLREMIAEQERLKAETEKLDRQLKREAEERARLEAEARRLQTEKVTSSTQSAEQRRRLEEQVQAEAAARRKSLEQTENLLAVRAQLEQQVNDLKSSLAEVRQARTEAATAKAEADQLRTQLEALNRTLAEQRQQAAAEAAAQARRDQQAKVERARIDELERIARSERERRARAEREAAAARARIAQRRAEERQAREARARFEERVRAAAERERRRLAAVEAERQRQQEAQRVAEARRAAAAERERQERETARRSALARAQERSVARDRSTDTASLAAVTKARACPAASITSSALSGGLLDVRISSACRAGQGILIKYGGATFGQQLDGEGLANYRLDLFAGAREAAMVEFSDGTSQQITIPPGDLADLIKVALIWQAPVDLDLHALEYAATPGSAGHIWSGQSLDAAAGRRETNATGKAHGFLSSAAGAQDVGDKIEVYTVFRVPGQSFGVVELFIDYASRGSVPAGRSCGEGPEAAVAFTIVQMKGTESLNRIRSQLTPQPCGVRLNDRVRFNRATVPDLRLRD